MLQYRCHGLKVMVSYCNYVSDLATGQSACSIEVGNVCQCTHDHYQSTVVTPRSI